MTEYKAFSQIEICHHCTRYQLNYLVDDVGMDIWDCTCHKKPVCVHKGRINTYACEDFLEVEE